MPFEAVTKIRFNDVDFAQILYYPRFFYLFHLAVEDLFDNYLGLPYAQMLKRDNLGLPAVHAEADYHHPLRFGDVVRIQVRIERVGNKSADFAYSIRREQDQVLCAEGRVTVVCVAMDSMTGVPIPDNYRRVFERYRLECQQARQTDGVT